MRSILRVFIGLAVAAAAGTTLLGAAAPFIPYWELINDFRPFLVAGLVVLTAIAWGAGGRRSLWSAGVVLVVNAALFVAPLLYASPGAPARTLRIATFNVWVGNPSAAEVVRFVAESGADIVVMQEVDARLEAALLPALRAAYPYAVSCAARNCGLMLLAKPPPVESGASDRTASEPPLLWARFAGVEGHAFTVTNVHLAYPFQPEWQARQIATLIGRFAAVKGTQILAGDFNLTPFSWKLNALTAATGLRRSATFAFSWPGNRLVPFVLLDNLLATPDVRSAGFAVGSSSHGSDHRPVVFDLAFASR